MNWLDLLLIALAAAFAIHGAARGFTRQILGLAATLAGLLLACWFYGSAGAFLLPYVSHKGIASFLGFLIVFLSVQTLGALAGWLASRFIRSIGLSWMDRLLGVVFGLLKAALIGVTLVVGLTAFAHQPLPAAVAGSRLAPVFVEFGRLVAALTPREMKDGFDRSYQNLKKFWREGRRDNEQRSLPSAAA